MYDKPKRKNVPMPDSFEFVTRYSVDECVVRLRDAAFRAVDQRISARSDGHRFVVEMPGQTIHGRYQNHTTTISVQGTLIPHGRETRVQGTVQDSLYKYGIDPASLAGLVAGGVMMLMGMLVFSASSGDNFSEAYKSLLFLWGIGAVAILVSLYAGARRRRTSRSQRAELVRLVRLWLEAAY